MRSLARAWWGLDIAAASAITLDFGVMKSPKPARNVAAILISEKIETVQNAGLESPKKTLNPRPRYQLSHYVCIFKRTRPESIRLKHHSAYSTS